jgi:adenosine/AMP kinase
MQMYYNNFSFNTSCKVSRHKTKLTGNDTEMTKLAAVNIIWRDTFVIYVFCLFEITILLDARYIYLT